MLFKSHKTSDMQIFACKIQNSDSICAIDVGQLNFNAWLENSR